MRCVVAVGMLAVAAGWRAEPGPAPEVVSLPGAVVARGAAPESPGDDVIRLRFPADRTPWEEYVANPYAADHRLRGRTVEFTMTAVVGPWPGGRTALLDVVNGRPLHAVVLRPGQEGAAARVIDGRLARVRGRVDRLEDAAGDRRKLCVVLMDGEVVHPRLRWDAAANDYVPDE